MKTTLAQWGLGLRKQFALILSNPNGAGSIPAPNPTNKMKLFKSSEHYKNAAHTKLVQALQAVVDAYGHKDSLLIDQCKDALKSAGIFPKKPC